MTAAFKSDVQTARMLRERARRATGRAISAGAQIYNRERDLTRLIHASPTELADSSAVMTRSILARLARALRSERNRGRAGHWTYDLNRHIALRQAYEAEKARLGRSLAGKD